MWTDRWVSNSSGGLIKATDTRRRFTSLLVHEIIGQSTGAWNIDHTEPFLNDNDMLAIKAIPIGDLGTDDKFILPHEKSWSYKRRSS